MKNKMCETPVEVGTMSGSRIFVFVCIIGFHLAASRNSRNLKVQPEDAIASQQTLLEDILFSNRRWANVGFTNDTSLIEAGDKSIVQLYNCEYDFFEDKYRQTDGAWIGIRLRANYQDRWTRVVRQVQHLVDNGKLHGFYLGDQLLWRGLDYVDLLEVVRTVKDSFPWLLVWYNEAATPIITGLNMFEHAVSYPIVPVGMDWVSFSWFEDEAVVVEQWYNEYLYPRMSGHQAAIIIPASYASKQKKNTTLEQQELEMMLNARDYYNWASADNMVIGIVAYHWKTYNTSTCSDCYNDIGTSALARLKSAWMLLGKSIVDA